MKVEEIELNLDIPEEHLRLFGWKLEQERIQLKNNIDKLLEHIRELQSELG